MFSHTVKKIIKTKTTSGSGKAFDKAFEAVGEAFKAVEEALSESSVEELEVNGVKVSIADGTVSITGEVKTVSLNGEIIHTMQKDASE